MRKLMEDGVKMKKIMRNRRAGNQKENEQKSDGGRCEEEDNYVKEKNRKAEGK